MYFGPFGNRIQWRVPDVPGLYPITGKILLWAGPIAPPAYLHPEVSARLRLGAVPSGDANVNVGEYPPTTPDPVTYISFGTDSDDPLEYTQDFTVESLGYILTSGAVETVLTFCTAEPTTLPTAEPTTLPTAEPTPEPSAKPSPKPKPSAKPSPKPTAKPSSKPTAKPSSKPKA